MLSLQTYFGQFIMEPYLSTCFHFLPFFSQVVNIEPFRKSPVHKWYSPVVKSIEHNSPVMKWETPCSPVHMNAALVFRTRLGEVLLKRCHAVSREHSCTTASRQNSRGRFALRHRAKFRPSRYRWDRTGNCSHVTALKQDGGDRWC